MLASCKGITKYQGDALILDRVDFNIEDNDKIGIVGINGTGKSTLLDIIGKKTDYQGDIIYKKDIKIAQLDQNPQFDLNKTIETIILEQSAGEINEYELRAIVNKFDLQDTSALIKTLSGGQIKRLALAIVLVKPCDLLILDEPTNHLDNQMIDYLEKFLIRFNKGLLLVTHDRYFLERITTKILEVDRSQLYLYQGNYEKFLELKAIREQDLLSAQNKRKQFLKKELEWVRAGVQARSTKQKSRLQRFEQLSSTKDAATIKDIEIFDKTTRLGKKTIELVKITKSYDKLLFDEFSYNFKQFDRIGILGDNGTGKSTLLNIITKNIEPTSGEVIHGQTIKIGYFKQGVHDLDTTMTVKEYIDNIAMNLTTNDGQLSSLNLMEQFNFDKKLQYTQISRLSGGQRRRLYLLSVLMKGPNVLVLDEPTNDLDIQTMATLEDFLDDFKGIVITVSHDRFFLDRVCSGLFILKDRHLEYVNGGYSINIDSFTAATPTKTKTTPSQQTRRNETKIKLSYQEKKDLEALPDQIEALESQIASIDSQLMSDLDYEAVAQLVAQREELNQELEDKSETYLELLEKEEMANGGS